MSPFGYNESVANEYFPMTKEEATKQGYLWSDYISPFLQAAKTVPADRLPDDIKDVPDEILDWAIECEITKKPFRITKPELRFLREHNLPFPRRHPENATMNDWQPEIPASYTTDGAPIAQSHAKPPLLPIDRRR